MFNSGFRGRRENDGQGSINPQAKYVQTKYPQPYISGWSISGSDDTALNPAGGQTVLVNGSGFATGISATLGGSQIGSVTLVNPTQISFTAPANAGGSYTLIVYNSTGGAAILVPGLTYSSVPTWTTAAGSIGSYYETTAINSNVVATSDSALTYTLSSGSLPSGATLYANGVITGTAPVDSGSTTYTFNITATDAELQDTTRTFTMTINVDVVTWVAPTNGTTYTVPSNVAISNVSLSATDAAGYGIVYSANSLPTGVSITGSVITGTPTTSGNTSTLLTATANTTGRTATNTINWVVQLGDSYWNLTTLALNSLPTTTPFQSDASLNNASITVAGDTKSSPYNPYQTGYYSNYFDGTGDSLTATNTTAFAFGTGDFTVEFWIYPLAYGSSVVGAQIFGTTNGSATGYSINLGQDINNFRIISNASGGWADNLTVSAGNGPSLNVWTHMAVVRSGANLTIYKNGVSVATTSSAAAWNFTGTVATIGYFSDGTYSRYLTGYISNLRAVKGLALYTTTFTPSTTPLVTVAGTSLLTCQSQRLIDTSPNNFAITKNGDTTAVPANPFATVYDYGTTYYSTYFDGTGDYFTAASGSIFTLGTGDFTIEAWIYPTSSSGTQGVLGLADTGGAGDLTFFYNLTSGKVTLNAYGGTAAVSTASVSTNVWTHVAFARASGSLKTFINGVLDNTTAFTGNFTKTAFVVGRSYSTLNQEYFVGQVSNLRVIKGQAIYTAAFTPSTTTLTTTSQGATAANVSILTCQSSTLIDNSLNASAITSNGDARPVPQSPFYSAYYSNYFDGSGDYLTVPSNAANPLGTTYTIECWHYRTGTASTGSYTSVMQLACTNAYGTSVTGFMLTYDGSSAFNFRDSSSSIVLTYSSTNLALNTWYHVAVVRNGSGSNNMTMYINGVSVATGTSSGTQTTQTAIYIGGDGSANCSFPGYISNFRITKGQALYTTAFTPATSPLTTTSQGATAGNVLVLTCQSLYFIDNSTNIFAITASGNTAVATVAPFTQPSQYGATTAVATYGSGYFDGTGDYLTYPSTTTSSVGSASAWTIEMWVYPTTSNLGWLYADVVSGTTYAVSMSYRTSNNLEVYFKTTGGTQFGLTTTSAQTVPINVWTHIALVKSGSNALLYFNGVLNSTISLGANVVGSGTTTYIGFEAPAGASSYYFTGYISNLRVVKGTALYTANFQPSSTPLTAVTNTQILTLQYNGGSNDSQFRDASNVQSLVTRAGNTTQGTFSPFSATGWSVYFDGNGDYLSIPNQAAVRLGAGDFTVEAWIFPNSVTNTYTRAICGTYGYVGTADRGWTFNINTSSKLSIYLGGSADPGVTLASTTSIVANVWTHVVACRSGTTLRLFINGVQDASTTTSKDENYTGVDFNIATYRADNLSPATGNSGTSFVGNISNLRIVIGSALYTSNFTPSTTPLTAVSKTTLLTLQSPAFVDNSASRLTITSNGDSKTQSFSPFSGVTTTQYYSNYFDGTGDYLSLATSSTFDFSTGSFTVEAWVYPTSLATDWFVISATGSGGLFVGYATGFGFGWGRTAVAWDYRPGTLTANTWQHVAVTRSGTSMYVFVNGTQAGTTQTLATAYNLGATATTVGSQGANYYLTGYISNLRVTKGQALYTANFTPATSPLTTTSQSATAANVSLLTCQSSTFIDNSTNAFAITVNGNSIPTIVAPFAATSTTLVSYTTSVNGGSAYFDGTGDYLATTILALGSGSFTIEFWAYRTVNQSEYIFVSGATPNWGETSGVQIISYLGNYAVTVGAANNNAISGMASYNAWHHFAVTRSGTAVKFFVDGVVLWSATDSTNLTGTALRLCNGVAGSWPNMVGYISGVRIVNGTALYTAAFSPPTAPPTSTAATTMLLNSTNGSIIDYTGKNDLETVADARLAPQNPYGGSYYSNYFDGSGDYLTVADNAALQFSTGNFTIECWVYEPDQSGVHNTVIGKWGTGFSTTGDWSLRTRFNSVTQLAFTLKYSGGYYDITTSFSVSNNAWHHIAVVRDSSTTIKLYADGVLKATQAVSSGDIVGSSATLSIGGNSTALGNEGASTGYISNARITKGQALYTTTFTPATSPLTTTSQGATAANVSLLTCQSSTFKDNSTNAFTVTRFGDTAVNSINPFQNNGTYSMYFDGTGDYNYIPATANFQFGTGDFTIEFWLYLNSVASNQVIYDNRNGANGAYPTIYMNTSSIRYYTNSADQITGATLTTGQWYYIAVCKASGSTKLFVNGTQSGSTFADSMNYLVAPLRIGSDYTPSSYLNGYVTDLRVTKYARYTTTFTPPTSTFQTK